MKTRDKQRRILAGKGWLPMNRNAAIRGTRILNTASSMLRAYPLTRQAQETFDHNKANPDKAETASLRWSMRMRCSYY